MSLQQTELEAAPFRRLIAHLHVFALVQMSDEPTKGGSFQFSLLLGCQSFLSHCVFPYAEDDLGQISR